MFNRILNVLNLKTKAKLKNTYITVKHMNSEITIFYKGKILTPNVDYSVDSTNGSNSVVKIFSELDKNNLQVFHSYISWHSKKLVMKPWGYKKFKVV